MKSKPIVFENYSLWEDIQLKAGAINYAVYESKHRSWVPYFVYLPPNWSAEKEYPLILFLHGQGGDESTFGKYVQANQLNSWIENSLMEPVVIAGVRGDNNRDEMQWLTSENEKLFAEDENPEFIELCQHFFKAGIKAGSISLYGHSRGAAGALHYGFKYPAKWTSVVAMGYVSDYTLSGFQQQIDENEKLLKAVQIPLRLEIGTEDRFVRTKNRSCVFRLNEFLEEKGLQHEFEQLHGVEHGFDSFWNYITEEGMENGLRHLLFHEAARKRKAE